MAKERAFITLVLAVDLDMVPGVCDSPQDFVTLFERDIKQAVPHYKPEIEVKDTVVKKYKWDDENNVYIQPKLIDDIREPKVGDITFDLSDGVGEIISLENLEGKTATIKLQYDGECVDLYQNELTWVDAEQRWEYGDLDRK